MIEVVLSNGDSAEAETPAEAIFAARHLMQEAVDHGSATLRLLTASFYTGSRFVREGVRYSELTTIEQAVA